MSANLYVYLVWLPDGDTKVFSVTGVLIVANVAWMSSAITLDVSEWLRHRSRLRLEARSEVVRDVMDS